MALTLNPDLASLPVYQPGRPIEEVARELGLPALSIIKLASNENPLGPSPAAMRAMENVIRNLHLYPDGNAFYLKKALAEKLRLDPSHLILGNGSNEIIEFVGHAVLRPRVEVLVSEYCFAIYPIVTRLFGAELTVVPAREFGHDLEAMERAIGPQTRLIFIANPNNPTGTRVSNAAIMQFIRNVPAHILCVLDEAYIEFLDDPPDAVSLVASGARPNLLLMRTFSKIFGLAGLRLGYGIGDPALVASLEKIRQPFNINSIAQAGALAALGDQEHVEATRKNNKAGLEYLSAAVAPLKLRYVPSSANFLLMEVGEGQKVTAELQRRGVIVRPMVGYGLPGWIRVSVGTAEQNHRFVEALQEVL